MTEQIKSNQIKAGSQANFAYDVEAVRADFPILSRTVYGKPLVYLDNGASAQKPKAVIEAVRFCYEEQYANVHRGAHYLSGATTDAFENARVKIARFINAASDDEIVFTHNATEAINLVAASYGRTHLQAGDEIVISEMEHHANIVPWQLLSQEKGLTLKIAPITDDGVLDMEAFAALLGPRTRLVAITHCSNVLGTVTPVKEIVALGHAAGAKVLIDGSQGIVHAPVDVRDIGADFYVFTGHKLYGPSGIGVLHGRLEVLETMPPYQGGGDMIERVTFEKTTFKEPPHRFEAGTPPIVQVIGLGAAIDYISSFGVETIAAHEHEVLTYANERLADIDGFRFIGTAPGKGPIVSFLVDGLHPLDVATVIDREGVATRVGHHCAEPLMDRLGVEGTLRASIGMYNTKGEIDVLARAIEKAKAKLG
ncbi:MAG TPA: cysteine desulfurase [Alphaproteobacteria bacterium]|nr:cysteine desulfurase [Alphaproteobacteria bacterium]